MKFPPKLHEEADEFENIDNPIDKLDRWNYDWLPEYDEYEEYFSDIKDQ